MKAPKQGKPGEKIGDGPLDPSVAAMMKSMARGIDQILNGDASGDEKKNGFILMVFPFGSTDGRANYVSNARREDVLAMLKEQVARFSGQPEMKGTA